MTIELDNSFINWFTWANPRLASFNKVAFENNTTIVARSMSIQILKLQALFTYNTLHSILAPTQAPVGLVAPTAPPTHGKKFLSCLNLF